MAIWQGEVQHCYWDYMTGKVTDDDWERLLSHTARLAKNMHLGGHTSLTIAYNASVPTASQRVALAKLLEQHSASLSGLLGHAFVTNKVISRGVLMAVNVFVKKPFPEKVLGTIEDGLRYLSKQNSALRIDRVRESLRGTVPASAFWK